MSIKLCFWGYQNCNEAEVVTVIFQ